MRPLEDKVKEDYVSLAKGYPSLSSLFEEHAQGISDEKRKYRYVTSAERMLSSINEVGFPKGVLAGLAHPEMIPYAKKQELPSSCGTSCLRTVLLLDYGVMRSEKWMWRTMEENGGDIAEGTAPLEITGIMRRVHEEEKLSYKGGEVIDIRFFMSRKGGLEQLAYLTDNGISPIINRPCYETGVGNHYEVVLGLDERFVYLYNPANSAPTSGFHKRQQGTFMDDWWPQGRGRERWYLAVVPETAGGRDTLPRIPDGRRPGFLGRYG